MGRVTIEHDGATVRVSGFDVRSQADALDVLEAIIEDD